MFIPWIGFFEQVRLADAFVHYDDVQLPQGRSFMSRVQIKTPLGAKWLTAPVDRKRSGNAIQDTFYVAGRDWRDKHLGTLRHCYARAPYFELMFSIAIDIFSFESSNLAEFNQHAIELLSAWLGLGTKFIRSSELNIAGSSTQRLVNICRLFGAQTYVTGLGGLRYLDHAQFECFRISVKYMAYTKKRYPQLHGDFTPYVSILDAIANCGPAVRQLICSPAIDWKDYHE